MMVMNICSPSFFRKFSFLGIHPKSTFKLIFSIILIKKAVYFEHALCHRGFGGFVRSVYPDIYHFIIFFDKILLKEETFYENNIIFRYYQIQPKVVLKVVHGMMDAITRTKTKTLPLRKKSVCYFFGCSVSEQTHVIPHPAISVILDVILNILQR